MYQDNKSSMLAGWISLISNVLLTVIKLIAGFFFQSGVLIADGIHNAGDVAATGAALGSMRVSNRPADDDHPYGHGKAEVIGAGIVAIILIIASLYMAYHSSIAFFKPPTEAHFLALIVAIVSLIWKQLLYMYTMKIGKAINSRGLIATAYDHLADVYASLAAVLGIGLALIGDAIHSPYLSYGDPAAGIVVSLLVLKLAIHMGKDSIDVLMEKNVEQHKLDQYTSLIQSIPEVKQIDRLRARELGSHVFIDVRVSVSAHLSVYEGHDIGRQIKQTIMEAQHNVYEVFVHINPWFQNESGNTHTK